MTWLLHLDHVMFTYPDGTTYSVTLVATQAQCVLVNQKVKGFLYLHHEKSPTHVRDITLSPITEMVKHACAITKHYKFRVKQHLLRLQICIHTYMWDSKTYGGYFQPIRSGIKNSRWRRPWKCDHVGKQHWGEPGIDFHGDNFKIDTMLL